jgi:uncharacterized protein (TIGR03067 family)
MKRRALQALVVAVLFASAAWCAGGPEPRGKEPSKDAVKDELKKLEGTWTMVSREAKGKKTPEGLLKKWRLTIKGDQWTANYPGGVDRATIRIDPTKDPKTMDLTFRGPGGGKVLTRGIYKLVSTTEGDTLTLCREGRRGRPRPKGFKTTRSAAILFVWKRAPR